MQLTFPGESSEYRAARDRLLAQEVDLRRKMEAVAAARRELPAGGRVPRDYVFQGVGVDRAPIDVRLSELFAPGKDALVIYNFMFPRDADDDSPGPASGQTACCRLRKARARRAPLCSTSSLERPSTPTSTSISRSWPRPRFHVSSRS